MGNKAKRVSGTVFISMIFLFLTVAGVHADKVILENGDTLTGTVEKMMDGKLSFKTDYAGVIEIQMAKIKQIITDNPVEVHLTNGEVVKGKVEPVEEGKLAVEPSPDRGATTVEIQSIASINPPLKELPKWHLTSRPVVTFSQATMIGPGSPSVPTPYEGREMTGSKYGISLTTRRTMAI